MDKTLYSVYLIYPAHTFSFKINEISAKSILDNYKTYKLSNKNISVLQANNYCLDFADCKGVYICPAIISYQERLANAQEKIATRYTKPVEGEEWKNGGDDE